jgi:hypothetical protein
MGQHNGTSFSEIPNNAPASRFLREGHAGACLERQPPRILSHRCRLRATYKRRVRRSVLPRRSGHSIALASSRACLLADGGGLQHLFGVPTQVFAVPSVIHAIDVDADGAISVAASTVPSLCGGKIAELLVGTIVESPRLSERRKVIFMLLLRGSLPPGLV